MTDQIAPLSHVMAQLVRPQAEVSQPRGNGSRSRTERTHEAYGGSGPDDHARPSRPLKDCLPVRGPSSYRSNPFWQIGAG